MQKLLLPCLSLLLAFNAGCSSTPLPEGEPARITKADAESRRELSQVIGAALGVRPVTLADDAFTVSSTLHFDPATAATGNADQGSAISSSAEVFRLLLDGPQCVLVHERTGLRWLLMDTECSAE